MLCSCRHFNRANIIIHSNRTQGNTSCKSLLGYIRKDDSSLEAAVLGVSNAIKKQVREFSIAVVEFDTDIDEGNEISSSSSAHILNTNVNTNLSKKVNYSDGKNSIILTFDMREYDYANNNHSSQH